jgi:hypothetical protein
MAQDYPAGCTLALLVAGITVPPGVAAQHVGLDAIRLELTDGWYSIQATIDAPLGQMVMDNKIVVRVGGQAFYRVYIIAVEHFNPA